MPVAVVAGISSRVTADQLKYLVVGVEVLMQGIGLILLIRLFVDPAQRARLKQPRLPAWDIPTSEFFVFLAMLFAGMLGANLLVGATVKLLRIEGDLGLIVRGASTQLGMLAGYFIFSARLKTLVADQIIPPEAPQPITSRPAIATSGVATFLMLLPIVTAVSAAWQTIIKAIDLPVEKQDIVGMFKKADSPWMVGIMIAMAVVIAPVVEELAFRAGFYRFLRTRIQHALALLAPSLFFAALHVNWQTLAGLYSLAPLVVLAIFFSLAYQHTGRIGTVIVAHALFNLNTVLVLFSGASND